VLDPYFGLLPEERFGRWASHKASICVPVGGDLAQRFFDSLVTGQIPLVAPDIADLDRYISRELQERLPVLRFRDYTADAVREALDTAVRLFDRDGEEGARRRHRYALEQHMFTSRVRSLIETADSLTGMRAGRRDA
jgi:hypothetical protein